jgi:HEAT repeat protein
MDSPLLHSALHDPDFRKARAAARELAARPDVAAVVAELTAALRHPEGVVRRRAGQALGVVGRAECVAPLLGALRDPAWTVREATAEALGPFAVSDDAARHALVSCSLEDRNPLVRDAAARGIGRLGETVVPELAKGLDHPHASVRARAARALSRLPASATVVGHLRFRLEDGHYKVREAAAVALGGCGEAAVMVLPRLVRACFENERRVRAAAVEAVIKLLAQERTAVLRFLEQPLRDGEPAEPILFCRLADGLPESTAAAFVAACSRRRDWDRRRRGLPEEPTAAATPTVAAAELTAVAGPAEAAWLLGWLCELFLR